LSAVLTTSEINRRNPSAATRPRLAVRARTRREIVPVFGSGPVAREGVALQPVDGELPAPGELVDHPEAHVVAGVAIGLARVAQPEEEAHAGG